MRASNIVVAALLVAVSATGLAACASDGPSSVHAEPGAATVRYELPGNDIYTVVLPSGERCVLYSGELDCDFPLRPTQQ